MPPKRAPAKAATSGGFRHKQPKSPLKRREVKGFTQHSTSIKVYVTRLKNGIWVLIVVNSSPKGKHPYLQDLVDKIKSRSPSSLLLKINRICHRRNPTAPEGADVELMDEEGIWPLRQFVHIVQEDEEDNEAAAAEWGRMVAREITELKAQSKYPKHCTFGGSLTAPTGPESVDTHLMNKDVVDLVDTLYRDNIDDESFWEYEDIVRGFFAHAEDPKTLFLELRE